MAANPSQRREPAGGARVKSNAGEKKRGGSTPRASVPMRSAVTKGGARTTTGVGTEDRNQPESGRARQDAARGTVHGQPRSGFNDGNNVRR